MQAPQLMAAYLRDDARVELQIEADGHTWLASFIGELGPDAQVEVRDKWDYGYVLDPTSEVARAIQVTATAWAMDHQEVEFEGTTLETRALLAQIMQELVKAGEKYAARSTDRQLSPEQVMAAMFQESVIREAMATVTSTASTFHGSRAKRQAAIAARAAAEADGTAKPDPLYLSYEFQINA